VGTTSLGTTLGTKQKGEDQHLQAYRATSRKYLAVLRYVSRPFTQEIAGSNPAGGTVGSPLVAGLCGFALLLHGVDHGADGSVLEAIVPSVSSPTQRLGRRCASVAASTGQLARVDFLDESIETLSDRVEEMIALSPTSGT
jgi:hypothetical protein